jgi:Carboxypeptidase regulatory-like domain
MDSVHLTATSSGLTLLEGTRPMIQHLTKFLVGVVLIFVLFEHPLLAQQSTAILTGSVTDSSGKPLPNVKISVKNVATGETTATETDSAGQYNLTSLAGEERNSGEGRYDVGVRSDQGSSLGRVQRSSMRSPGTIPAVF